MQHDDEELYTQAKLIEARARRTIKGPARDRLMARAAAKIKAATAVLSAETARIRADLTGGRCIHAGLAGFGGREPKPPTKEEKQAETRRPGEKPGFFSLVGLLKEW